MKGPETLGQVAARVDRDRDAVRRVMLVKEIRATIYENMLRYAIDNVPLEVDELVIQVGPDAYRRLLLDADLFEFDREARRFRGVAVERVPDLEGWRLVRVLPTYA